MSLRMGGYPFVRTNCPDRRTDHLSQFISLILVCSFILLVLVLNNLLPRNGTVPPARRTRVFLHQPLERGGESSESGRTNRAQSIHFVGIYFPIVGLCNVLLYLLFCCNEIITIILHLAAEIFRVKSMSR